MKAVSRTLPDNTALYLKDRLYLILKGHLLWFGSERVGGARRARASWFMEASSTWTHNLIYKMPSKVHDALIQDVPGSDWRGIILLLRCTLGSFISSEKMLCAKVTVSSYNIVLSLEDEQHRVDWSHEFLSTPLQLSSATHSTDG